MLVVLLTIVFRNFVILRQEYLDKKTVTISNYYPCLLCGYVTFVHSMRSLYYATYVDMSIIINEAQKHH